MRENIFSASILNADFASLAEDIKKAEKAGVEMFHLDIMDGHFVPNITFGPKMVKDLRRRTSLPLESHLMISQPLKYLDDFISAGSDWISVHIETLNETEAQRVIEKLKAKLVKVGFALNPDTPLSKIVPFLEDLDFVLIMSVFPGFGGQRFIPEVLDKISGLRKEFSGDIAVDGGLSDKTLPLVAERGANIFCVGSFIFSSSNYTDAIRRLKNAISD